jgi:hypothetical protein
MVISTVREKSLWKFTCEADVFLNTVISLGTQQQHGGERKVCSPGKRENKPLAGLYRIFDVIKTIINLVRV